MHEINFANGGVPGAATGLFWTTAIDDDDVTHVGTSSATVAVIALPIFDEFQIFTSPAVPATLTLSATLRPLQPANVSTTSYGSTYDFVGSTADVSLQFSVSSRQSRSNASPFLYIASGAGAKTTYARVGTEKNGIYATS